MYHCLVMDKELNIKLKGIVKTWAKNNMCASCYSDTEVFVSTMEDIIDLDLMGDLLVNCLDEVEFFGIKTNPEIYDEVHNMLKVEAKYWLNDYYKHKKDYDPEVINDEF